MNQHHKTLYMSLKHFIVKHLVICVHTPSYVYKSDLAHTSWFFTCHLPVERTQVTL